MINDISCDGTDNKDEFLANARVVKVFAKKFGIGQWSFIGPGSEKKWYSMEENSRQGILGSYRGQDAVGIRRKRMSYFPCNNSIVQVWSQKQRTRKIVDTFYCGLPNNWDYFSHNCFCQSAQSLRSSCNMCEEFESHQDRSGQLDVLMGQSIVLSEIKAEVLLKNDIPSHQNLLLQRYEERIKLLSQENKVSKFCMNAGVIHVVEIGQYFMTKDIEEQFFARACREYILPRNDESSQPKGWIHGNTRIGLVLAVTISYLWGKYGIEVRIKDNSQSWVRISHGSNKFVVDLNYNNTEVLADLFFWRTSVTTDCESFCSQIKGESKTTKKRTCWFTEHHSDEWKKVDLYWTRRFFSLCVRDFEESNPSSSTF